MPTLEERAAGQRLIMRMSAFPTADDFIQGYSPREGEAVWLRVLGRAMGASIVAFEAAWADARGEFDDPGVALRRRPVGLPNYLDRLLRDGGLTFGDRWTRIGHAGDRALVLHARHETEIRKLGAQARFLLEVLAARDLVVDVSELSTIELGAETWRHRQYAEIQRTIGAKQRQLLEAEQNPALGKDPAQIASELVTLEKLAMKALQLMPEYERKNALVRALEDVSVRKVVVAGGVEESPAATEYARLREELEHIEASLASAVVSRSRPAPTPPAPKRIVQLKGPIDISKQMDAKARAETVKAAVMAEGQEEQELIVIEPYYESRNEAGDRDTQ